MRAEVHEEQTMPLCDLNENDSAMRSTQEFPPSGVIIGLIGLDHRAHFHQGNRRLNLLKSWIGNMAFWSEFSTNVGRNAAPLKNSSIGSRRIKICCQQSQQIQELSIQLNCPGRFSHMTSRKTDDP
jgi:hypothetical protein